MPKNIPSDGILPYGEGGRSPAPERSPKETRALIEYGATVLAVTAGGEYLVPTEFFDRHAEEIERRAEEARAQGGTPLRTGES